MTCSKVFIVKFEHIWLWVSTVEKVNAWLGQPLLLDKLTFPQTFTCSKNNRNTRKRREIYVQSLQ